MTPSELRQTFLDALVHVAPDAEPDALDPDAPLRDQMDLDSMDLLNLVIRLNEVLGVEVPERDYPRLDSVSHAVAYLEGALSARG
ncbi:MAG: acyl carrier protein [Planctomycetes bacterium]|nr:acyl carrier protein [Planctomycetota bacterium]